MDLVNTVRKEGSRGGRGDFKWSDVQADQHRENYLGHSLMAPVGRWQRGKDLQWYSRNKNGEEDEADGLTPEERARKERKEEIARIKQAEKDAMNKALGYELNEEGPLGDKNGGTGANATAVMGGRMARKEEKEDRPRKREHKHRHRDGSRDRNAERAHRHRRHRSRSRSRSRSRDHRHRHKNSSRSRSPGHRHRQHRERSPSPDERHDRKTYRKEQQGSSDDHDGEERKNHRPRRQSRSPYRKSRPDSRDRHKSHRDRRYSP